MPLKTLSKPSALRRRLAKLPTFALSVRQPVAQLLVTPSLNHPNVPIKWCENRTWEPPKKLIGERILIHTGCTRTVPHYYAETRMEIEEHGADQPRRFEHSAIIGSVRLVGIVRMPSDLSFFARFKPWFRKAQAALTDNGYDAPDHGQEHFTHDAGVVWWIMAEPEMLDVPIEMKGRLNLWKPIDQLDT